MAKPEPFQKLGFSSSSKYDFVKVRVRLEEHYYILSRFIVSRILSVIQ
eukprot:gene11977-10340_t